MKSIGHLLSDTMHRTLTQEEASHICDTMDNLQARLSAAEAVAEAAAEKIKCKGIPALKEGCIKDSFAIRDCDFYDLCSALMIWRGKNDETF